jgi:hypothetical protein
VTSPFESILKAQSIVERDKKSSAEMALGRKRYIDHAFSECREEIALKNAKNIFISHASLIEFGIYIIPDKLGPTKSSSSVAA